MRIVLDLQGAQGSNSTRGIGRYSLALARAMARQAGKHEIVVALNGSLTETIGPLRAAFKDLVAPENICVWQALSGVSAIDRRNGWRRQASERMREAFLADLRPDVVLVSSMFEGLGDDAVTSIGAFADGLPTAVTLYDLIPFIRRETYMRSPVVESWYETKLGHLRRADLCLAISESSRREGIDLLGLPEDRIVSVSAAADARFRPQELSDDAVEDLCQRLDLRRPFVMYTGGMDPRKNIEGLIRAYSLLPRGLRDAHQLVIACAVQPDDTARLKQLSAQYGLAPGDLIITGFVTDADLVALYNLCEVFVFPSLHEGFGLPALEAMACGAAVIGSATSSLPEVIGHEDAMFDPSDERAIAAAIHHVLADEAFRTRLQTHGLGRASEFSWESTAQRVIGALEGLHNKSAPAAAARAPRGRPKLAYASPLPPERSGIADYSAELLGDLARHYDIDVIVDQADVEGACIKSNCTIRSPEWLEANAHRYDRILYQFGNSHFHKHMFGLLQRHPGVVCLHDFFLSGALFHMERQGDPARCWSHALYGSHGYAALAERGANGDPTPLLVKYPVNRGVLENAVGVIVHSEFSRALAAKWYGPSAGQEWVVVPQVRRLESPIDRIQARRDLGLSAEDFVVCSFGIVAETKLSHRLLEAWSQSALAKNRNCRLVFVGDHYGSDYGARLARAIARSLVPKNVCVTGFASNENYRLWLSAADLAVQLRTKSRGETSRAALDCMSFGLPMIVNSHGSMHELGAGTIVSDEFSDVELTAALERLCGDASLRMDRSRLARQRIAEHHNPRQVAEQFKAAIEGFYRNEAAGQSRLITSLVALPNGPADETEWVSAAAAVTRCTAKRLPVRQLLVDVSDLATVEPDDQAIGAARSILGQLLVEQPAHLRIEPIYHAGSSDYRYARQFTSRLLGLPTDVLCDEAIEFGAQDLYLALFPLSPSPPIAEQFLSRFRVCGGRAFLFLDQASLPAAQQGVTSDLSEGWARLASQYDGVICAARALGSQLRACMNAEQLSPALPLSVSWLHDGDLSSACEPFAALMQDKSSRACASACRKLIALASESADAIAA